MSMMIWIHLVKQSSDTISSALQSESKHQHPDSKWHWQEIIRYIKSLSLINYMTPLLDTYYKSSSLEAPLRPRQSHQPVTRNGIFHRTSSLGLARFFHVFAWWNTCAIQPQLVALGCDSGQMCRIPLSLCDWRGCTHDEAIQRCGATGTVIVEPPWYSHNQVFHCYRNHQPLSCLKIPEMSK